MNERLMDRAQFTLTHRLRVRWAEVDMQAVVFNPQYLVYFDVAVAEYWRAISEGRTEGLRDDYLHLYSVKATVEFHASARYDEEIDVCCRVARIGRSSLNFTFGIWRGDALLVSGEIVYVYTDPDSARPAPVPERLRNAITRYERTAPEVGAPR
jgi:YbgC/YbaW family acyl-CoA thioester hydrolase